MKCDKCGVALTVSNTGGHAPYGIPLFVCKTCYNKLKESEKDLQTSKAIVFNSLQEQLEYTKNSRRIQKVINVPNYQKIFSCIDNGVKLYYFNDYQTEEIVDKLQAVNIMSYGLKLYEKIKDREVATSWIENGGELETRVGTLRDKQKVIEALEMPIDVFKDV
jgi:DNA-directed RNA polymerase subunit M/transcription elongation factor TFIIS